MAADRYGTTESTATASTIRLSIDFPINSHTLLPDFSGNRATLDSLDAILARSVRDSLYSIRCIEISGTASPDGVRSRNLELATRRMLSIVDMLKRNPYLGSGIEIMPSGSRIAWEEFRELVEASDIESRETILTIASRGSDNSAADGSRRLSTLKRLRGGKVWTILAEDIFPRLRCAVMLALTVEKAPSPTPNPVLADTASDIPALPAPEPEPEVCDTSTSQAPACPRGWHLETNLLEWSLAIANIAGEFDFGRRWSAALSLHYSAWDYGRSTRKFRTFIFRPEVRRWLLNDCHTGLFVDAHLQMAAYNFALPGWEYRVQDAGGTHPALGGGIGVGYRLPLGSKGRWALQAQVGAGVYRLDYNRFENRPDGAPVDRRRRTFFGLDNAAVSVVFNFNGLKK